MSFWVDNYTDLKAIIMEKNIRKGDRPSLYPIEGWLALGHMDWIQIQTVPGVDCSSRGIYLQQMKEYSQSLYNSGSPKSIYRQPLYILREFPSATREKVDHFWSWPSAFMAVTRIHSNGQGQKQLEADIECQFRKNNGNKGSYIFPWSEIPTRTERLEHRVMYICYRTLELSDMILVAKSDSAEALLSCIGQLYFLPDAGDVYSYYCVGMNELSPTGGQAVDDDCISLLSIRFDVRDAQACRPLIQALQSHLAPQSAKAYIITGMEDVNLITYDNSSQKLCSLFRNIISMGNDFRQAFKGCITRLGLQESRISIYSPNSDTPPALKEKLTNAYCRLERSFVSSLNDSTVRNKDWVHPLGEMINLLSRISQDCVLWQISYILLNGIQGIVQHIKKWSPINSKHDEDNDREIMRMVQGVDRLMEHIIRMEGELVHHPETRPILFDIPINVLEFYLLFLDQCTQYLQIRERQNIQRNFQLLLIPNLCQQISIHDHLNIEQGRDRLLYVEIPQGLLYDPFHVVCVLAHEAAHHSGEVARNRDLRFQSLVACTAFIIADELDMGASNAVFRRLKTSLEESFPIDKQTYMRDIIDGLLKKSGEICQSEAKIEDLWTIYTRYQMADEPTARRLEWLSQHAATYRRNKGGHLLNRLDKLLWEVEYLFKETYADLVMLTLLGLKAEEYINMLERPNSSNLIEDAISYACMIERAALVLCAIDPEGLLGLSDCVNVDHPLADDIRRYCYVLLEKDDPEQLLSKNGQCGCHSLDVAGSILIYLQTCYEVIQGYDSEKDNIQMKEEIQRVFREYAVKQRFASLDFFRTIEEYRPKIIERENGY